MAKIISFADEESVPKSEHSVLQSLRRLDDTWTVLHSVAWQCPRNGRQGDGEADFVVIHPRHGLIILEVKGGGIELVQGKWYTSNVLGRFEIKDPFKQAVDSKYALLSFFRGCIPWFGKTARICHGVVFPDVTIERRIALMAPNEIIIDSLGLEDIESALKVITNHWQNESTLTARETEAIVNKLAPTHQVRYTLATRARKVSDALIQLTREQITALDGLDRNRRALILGGAGSGKTLLATEKAKRLAANSFEVLVVCFNELLGRELHNQFVGSELITAGWFHSLVMGLAGKAKIRIPSNPSTTWWADEAPVILVEAAATIGFSPDAILIDEVQDFSWSWIQALIAITKDPSSSICFAFGDSKQDIYGRDLKSLTDWAQFELRKNCRNSFPIATKVTEIVRDSNPVVGPEGPAPTFYPTDFRSLGMSTIQNWTEELIEREGFSPSEIVVLTDTLSTQARICELTAGAVPFCGYGQNGVVVETVRRFKGLEAEVILIVWPGTGHDEALQELAYIGVSRARSVLFVFAPELYRKSFGF